ncbi:MAG: hypothetical protein EPO07_07290 [Verrucomicrobia bacterium]|nr:MAG: hypothetical protein EPO07_07290 [Verrucomicrobiota bacterium]
MGNKAVNSETLIASKLRVLGKDALIFRGLLTLALFVLTAAWLSGCKSQMTNPVFVHADNTNTVVVIPPNATFVSTPCPVAITVTNPISVTVTNFPIRFPEEPISLTVTGVTLPEITNHVYVTALLISTNSRTGGLLCDCNTNLFSGSQKVFDGCHPWWCKLLDILDHNLKAILDFFLAIVAGGGTGLIVNRKDKDGKLQPLQGSQVAALGIFLFVILFMAVGIWFVPSGSTGPAWTARDVERLVSETAKAAAGRTGVVASAKFPVEITVAIFTAIISGVAAVVLFYFRRSVEKGSINMAVLSEIRRLLIVVDAHRKWRKDSQAEKATDLEPEKRTGSETTPYPPISEKAAPGKITPEGIVYPLIRFSHPVYSRQVENIGLLRKCIVADAVAFYGWIDYINSFQDTRGSYQNVGKLGEFNDRYDGMIKKFLKTFEHTFDSEFRRAKLDPIQLDLHE